MKKIIKLKKYKVTLTLWRETWNGYDQKDGDVEQIIEALGEKSAIKKAVKNELNPGKGYKWSHTRWYTNAHAELI